MTIKEAIMEIGEINTSTNSLQNFVYSLLTKGRAVEAIFHFRKAQENGTWQMTNQMLRKTRSKRTNKRNKRIYGSGWPLSKNKKLEILRQQGYRCNICKEKNRPNEADHILAVTLGGTNDVSNIQILCTRCHRRKDAHLINKSLEEQIIL